MNFYRFCTETSSAYLTFSLLKQYKYIFFITLGWKENQVQRSVFFSPLKPAETNLSETQDTPALYSDGVSKGARDIRMTYMYDFTRITAANTHVL